MFDHTSLRFLINLILGNIVFFLWLAALNESFGTVRPKYVINPEKIVQVKGLMPPKTA